MFESPDFPKTLDEDVFDLWLEKGRESKIKYQFMVVLWDEYSGEYSSRYVEDRSELMEYAQDLDFRSQERVVAVYDLYSESRLSLANLGLKS